MTKTFLCLATTPHAGPQTNGAASVKQIGNDGVQVDDHPDRLEAVRTSSQAT